MIHTKIQFSEKIFDNVQTGYQPYLDIDDEEEDDVEDGVECTQYDDHVSIQGHGELEVIGVHRLHVTQDEVGGGQGRVGVAGRVTEHDDRNNGMPHTDGAQDTHGSQHVLVLQERVFKRYFQDLCYKGEGGVYKGQKSQNPVGGPSSQQFKALMEISCISQIPLDT